MMHRSENFTDFRKDSEGYVQAYTNGSCENNDRSNAKAGVGVWFGENHPKNISLPASHQAKSNSAQIEACTLAIAAVYYADERHVTINTDSEFVVKSMNERMPKWKTNGWKIASGEPVKNRTEFQELDRTIQDMDNVQFKYVPGRGIGGIEQARLLARQGAQLY